MGTSDLQPVVMTPGAVAKLYGVRPDTVLGWIRSGLMPAVNMARAEANRERWRVSQEDLAEFRKRRAAQPVAKPAPKRRQRAGGQVKEFV